MSSDLTQPATTYLDYNGYGSADVASLPQGTPVPTTDTTALFNVALVLDRAHDPTGPGGVLTENWAARQKTIGEMNAQGTMWSTYGAKLQDYNELTAYLNSNNIAILGANSVPGSYNSATSTDGYTTSPESRTIWVTVTGANFNTLFGDSATLYQSGNGYYWTGYLALPALVKGLWLDEKIPDLVYNGSIQQPATLNEGIQGVGNGLGQPKTNTYFPQQIARLYNYPLADGQSVPTGAIGLVEPGSGDNPYQQFQQLLSNYQDSALSTTGANVQVIGVQNGGTPLSQSTERSLDSGIATTVNPQSPLVLYAGSGNAGVAQSEAFTSYFQAVWDTTNHPGVLSSSVRFNAAQPNPDSPFAFAARELFIDAALRNMSVFSSSGDGGSSYQIPNGQKNVDESRASPYVIMVGGTSLSTADVGQADTTLPTNYYNKAAAGDRDILWSLIKGGLTTKPPANPDSEPNPNWFVETVWNRYDVTSVYSPTNQGNIDPGYLSNESSNAGVDHSQPAPWYQGALEPTLAGRALPDVVALAGGNMFYDVPDNMSLPPTGDGGTSAATPFWASLAVQINAILVDQGFPAGTQLGYWNDLLYIAAAIAPGAFNDISMGDNTSSFRDSSSANPPYISTDSGSATPIVPTGLGEHAAPGIDIATGLGSPNGTLLARAISDIAHSQMFFPSDRGVLDVHDTVLWTSTANQDLLVQVTSLTGAAVAISADGSTTSISSPASGHFAWTSQIAQQVLQSDFDMSLVRMFDGASQGMAAHATLNSGESLSVAIDGGPAFAYSAALTNAFGFDDFQGGANDTVRVARPVAVAQGHSDDVGTPDFTAIVRIRQDGQDKVDVALYRVDDLTGTIGTSNPGDADYAAKALARAYETSTGDKSIAGPGYGKFVQAELPNVGPGDIIAFKLTNETKGNTFWGFTQANETVDGQKVVHLWNYGLNTLGFEDRYGGGDKDYNDVIVGVDFTSASGQGLLVR